MSSKNGARNRENGKPKSLLLQKEGTSGFRTLKNTIETNVLSIVYPLSEPEAKLFKKKCIIRTMDFQRHLGDVIRFVLH